MINMNKKRILGAALALFTAMSMSAATYTFKIAKPIEDMKLQIHWCTSGEKSELEVQNGVATLSKNDFTAQYVRVYYGRAFAMNLYLEPDKDLTVDCNAEAREFNCTGAAAAINNYLIKSPFAVLDFNAAAKEEVDFIKSSDSVYNANLALMKSANLPAYFVKKEEQRLLFKSYVMFPLYKSYHPYMKKMDDYTPTALYMNKLKELAVMDGNFLGYAEYGDFIMNAVFCQAFQGGDRSKELMAFMDANVKDSKVKSYITNVYAYDVVSSSGLDGNDELVAYFHKNVSDPKLVDMFDKVCKQWEGLKAGCPSPSFTATDINGKQVSLESLKGKYVYIDVWATWCGPCRGELPYMTKLEEQYAGKDIHFVGLSCDSNKSAWEKRIQKGDIKGIQLCIGPNSDFMQKYLVKGIPRFILLDREDRIIKANAPRPSDPNITKIFDELLKN